MNRNSPGWACALILALFTTAPADAIVIFTGNYQVGGSSGDAGIASGDTVSVSAFYDPMYANLEYQTNREAVFSFGAEHAGLSFTINDRVWRTVGPLTVQTYFNFDDIGRPKDIHIEFLGYTRVQGPGVVTTTLETPWSSDVNANAWLLYLPVFDVRDGLNPYEVLGPRLYRESDFASLLQPANQDIFGAAFADTTTGVRGFNFLNPNYVPPATSVPEPSVMALFGVGMLSLVVLGRRRSLPSSVHSRA